MILDFNPIVHIRKLCTYEYTGIELQVKATISYSLIFTNITTVFACILFVRYPASNVAFKLSHEYTVINFPCSSDLVLVTSSESARGTTCGMRWRSFTRWPTQWCVIQMPKKKSNSNGLKSLYTANMITRPDNVRELAAYPPRMRRLHLIGVLL